MGRMAARWVLKHVYEQPQEVQQVFEPRVVERDSVSRAS
jgi:DNA-binding LacI/PurR family transcriptional regulator